VSVATLLLTLYIKHSYSISVPYLVEVVMGIFNPML
jgi:hypothetical protein